MFVGTFFLDGFTTETIELHTDNLTQAKRKATQYENKTGKALDGIYQNTDNGLVWVAFKSCKGGWFTRNVF